MDVSEGHLNLNLRMFEKESSSDGYVRRILELMDISEGCWRLYCRCARRLPEAMDV